MDKSNTADLLHLVQEAQESTLLFSSWMGALNRADIRLEVLPFHLKWMDVCESAVRCLEDDKHKPQLIDDLRRLIIVPLGTTRDELFKYSKDRGIEMDPLPDLDETDVARYKKQVCEDVFTMISKLNARTRQEQTEAQK